MTSKSESKALIEAYAKQTGKPTEEVAAEIAALFGYQKAGIPVPTPEGKMSPIMEAIVAASGKGEKLDSKAMFESMMTLKMMEMMGAPRQQDSGQNINDIINKNNEMWERRLEQMKQEQKEANLQRQLDDMKTLILSSSGSKKEELSEKFEKLNEKLDAEKEKRFADALDNKSAEIEQLKEYMQTSLEDMRNQPTPKGADEGFFEMMQKMERFDNIVRSRGKALGMTDEQIEKEVAEATPMKQQMLKDGVRLLERWIDASGGKKTTVEPAIAEEPQVAQIVCKNCGDTPDNGTEYCNPCRQAYVEQQKEGAEVDTKARKAGEIPAEVEQTAPAPVEEEEIKIS